MGSALPAASSGGPSEVGPLRRWPTGENDDYTPDAVSTASLQSYRDSGLVDEVEILGSGRSCSTCAEVVGRRFTLNEVPTLPIQGCTADRCACAYAPVVHR